MNVEEIGRLAIGGWDSGVGGGGSAVLPGWFAGKGNWGTEEGHRV